jgi:hypothetical protein
MPAEGYAKEPAYMVIIILLNIKCDVYLLVTNIFIYSASKGKELYLCLSTMPSSY